jgi:hypothetical protein
MWKEASCLGLMFLLGIRLLDTVPMFRNFVLYLYCGDFVDSRAASS